MVFLPLQIQKKQKEIEGTEDCSKKRHLMEVLYNVLSHWFKRLSIIPFNNFPAFVMPKLNQLFMLKEVAPKDPIEEYSEDIHNFYRLYERKNQQRYYLEPSGITPRERACLINYIVKVHQMLQLSPETLYLTVSIFDRFLAQETVARVQLKLVGMCAMFIASKYQETQAPLLQDLTDTWMLRYSTSDVLKMEQRILNKIDWALSLPTPYMFIVRYINLTEIDKETECMIFFYAELALTQFLIDVFPSLVAASCVYAARCTLQKNPLWTIELERSTCYTEPYLLECTRVLMHAHSRASNIIISSSVYDKYSHESLKKVALRAPAKVDAFNS